MIRHLFIVSILCLTAAGTAVAGPTDSWKIRKDSWSATDEKNFEKWIGAIGDSGCNSVELCMKNPVNPYRASDPRDTKFYADCSDLPYLLRSYFAWKNGLPFGIVSEVVAAPGPDGQILSNDIRYSPFGNKVSKRNDLITPANGKFKNGIQMINIAEAGSSAMFRFHPSANDSRLFTDHYPVKLSRESIRPGTMIYDPNGHVAVVYKVLKDGRVLFMDAHPDNSLSRGTYGKKFARSRPGMGAGFKNWRPIRLVDAKTDADLNLLGGRITGALNETIADYSDEQFFGTVKDPGGKWNLGKFVFNGQTVEYYDYVRRVLAVGTLRYQPLEEFRNMLLALCGDLKDRVDAVQQAIGSGIDKTPHPERLPYNIYGTDGAWETYSTPSRDARLKTSFKEMRDKVQEFVEKFQAGDKSIVYEGRDLKADLLQTFEKESKSCVIAYRGLNLEDVMNRLYLLSFDPYHCLERRWGATSAEELRTCADDGIKARWFEGEQRLRNQIDRTYDTRMDHTLEDLFVKTEGNGVALAPDVDVRKL